MRFMPSIKNEIVNVSFSPQTIVCSWIKYRSASQPYHINAYQRFQLKNLELEKQIIFNPTHITRLITSFLKKYHLHNAFALFSVTGTGIFEEIITCTEASPTQQHFNIPALKKMVWDYVYLYPLDQARYTFYICGIPQELLLQYLLLANALPVNILTVTTQHMALLNLYRKLHSSSFNHSQLGVDIAKHHNNLHDYFTPKLIEPMFSSDVAINLEQELLFLSTALGLFIMRDTRYE